MDILCANCERFEVLDDMPMRCENWFGTCYMERVNELGSIPREAGDVLDWAYAHGRHGQDDCERPNEWFEAVPDE